MQEKLLEDLYHSHQHSCLKSQSLNTDLGHIIPKQQATNSYKSKFSGKQILKKRRFSVKSTFTDFQTYACAKVNQTQNKRQKLFISNGNSSDQTKLNFSTAETSPVEKELVASEDVKKEMSTLNYKINSQMLVDKTIILEEILFVFKCYTLQLQTLFLSVHLMNKFLDRISCNKLDEIIQLNISLTQSEKLRVVTLIILSISAKYQERIAFRIEDLLKTANLQYISIEPDNVKQLEFKILRAIDFKVGINCSPQDSLAFTLQQSKLISELPPHLLVLVKEASLFFCFILMGDQNVPIQFSLPQIISVSIYMALKLVERKSNCLFLKPSSFSEILLLNCEEDELSTVICSLKLIEILSQGNKTFKQTKTLHGEFMRIML